MISTGRHLVGCKVRVIPHRSVLDGQRGIVRGFRGRSAFVAMLDSNGIFRDRNIPVAFLVLAH